MNGMGSTSTEYSVISRKRDYMWLCTCWGNCLSFSCGYQSACKCSLHICSSIHGLPEETVICLYRRSPIPEQSICTDRASELFYHCLFGPRIRVYATIPLTSFIKRTFSSGAYNFTRENLGKQKR